MSTLKPFDDRDVTEATIRIVRAGDGLSDALEVDPVEFALDDIVHVVLRCQVTRIAYEEIKDSDELRRVHTLRATSGTIVDEQFAKAVLAEQQTLIERARGVQRLPIDGDDE
jgi:hypothetical protein